MCKINYKNYSPLHCHSVYSKDGYGPWELMVKRAKELDMPALAMTDHGTASGFVTHYSLCKDNDIKPIYGIEGYMSPDVNAKKVVTNHITILAQTNEGYNNLIELNNAAHRNMVVKRGGLKFPLTTWKHLKDYRKGLIILTGCPASMIYNDDFEIAYNYVSRLVKIFGEEHVFAELMFVLEGHDHHSRPLQMCSETGIRPVITNDTHYTYEDDAENHMICLGIRARAMTGTEYSYDNKTLFLMSGTQLADKAVQYIDEETVAECFDNIAKIVSGLEEVELANDIAIPFVSDEEISELKRVLEERFEEYCKNNPKRSEQAHAVFKKEITTIDTFDFWSYFYIVYDIVRWVRERNRFSTARGSAGGSLVIYLLDICTVDPLKYNLMFERFLNAAREDYPDIDLDVDSSLRPQLVEYCKERWGLETVNTTITFGHKSLVRDIAKKFEIKHDDMTRLANIGETSDEFLEFCENNPKFAHAYSMMIDQPKTVGTHAAAMASVQNDLPLPIEAWGNTPGIAYSESGSLKSLSTVGGLKFDILGVTALASLHRMYELTGVMPPKDIDTEFPTSIFANGKTLGIFQFDGSAGIQRMCLEIKPNNLDELATINSMYRPGALDAGTAENYMVYKENPRKFTPEIDKVLAPTYSVIVFQEQVMDIYRIVTNEGLEGADIARRILSPKSPKVLQDPKWQKAVEEVRLNFLSKGEQHGIDTRILIQLWNELYHHSRYSFNKSHSIAYADLAARQAWYKLNYPTEFYLATINTLLEEGKNVKLQDYVWTMFLEGFKVEPPNVMHSSTKFEINDGKLYLPITVVKYVSQSTLIALELLRAYVNGNAKEYIDKVLEECETDEKVKLVTYFDKVLPKLQEAGVTEINTESLSMLSVGHIWNKRAKTNLYRIGALDDVPGDILNILPNVELAEETCRLSDYIECMDVTIPNETLLKYKEQADRKSFTFGIIMSKVSKLNTANKAVVVYNLTDNNVIRIYESQKELLENYQMDKGTPVTCITNEWGYLQFEGPKYAQTPRMKCITD